LMLQILCISTMHIYNISTMCIYNISTMCIYNCCTQFKTMKIFNDFERSILKKLLVEFRKNDVSICLFSFFKQNILINRAIVNPDSEKSKQITIHYNKDSDKNAPKEIFNFLTLIEYLEINSLIIKIKNDCKDYNNYFISYNLEDNHPNPILPRKGMGTSTSIPNYSITFLGSYNEKINLIYHQDIFLSSELIELIENDFVSIENKSYRQSKNQTKLSFLALILSLLTLLFSIHIFNKSESKTLELNDIQFNKIQQPLNQINSKMDDLKKAVMIRDTIKVKN
jgi:hypothetical protein